MDFFLLIAVLTFSDGGIETRPVELFDTQEQCEAMAQEYIEDIKDYEGIEIGFPVCIPYSTKEQIKA